MSVATRGRPSLRRRHERADVPADASAVRATFVLTFDFEDWHQLVHRRLGRPDWRAGSPEFEGHVANVLHLLADLGVSATFFVAGVTAERHPEALQEVVARGHEVACHGYEHRRAYRQTPSEFRRDVVRGLETVTDICGETPIGYRAPWFSITRGSFWARDVLLELGFRYDSSLYDSPRIPRRMRPIPSHPFRLGGDAGDGLWELPIAVARWGRAVLPLGGGQYWRYLPAVALWRGLDNVARRSAFPVLYFHPYECATEPLRVVLPAGASRRERLHETQRRVTKNTRLELIPARIREAARRFRLVACRDVIALGDG
jgi:polysaccharide deacetylase family protein (PEP-CTERM system associated)